MLTHPMDETTGELVRVVDGDTVVVSEHTVLGRITDTTIRLAAVDTPERAQAYGATATEALGTLLRAAYPPGLVHVEHINRDRYRRYVARVRVDVPRPVARLWGYAVPPAHRLVRIDASEWLVRFGHGWAVHRYGASLATLARMALAKEQRRGLWATDAIAPADWRAQRRVRK